MFSILPNEILERIFVYCDANTLVNFMKTSKNNYYHVKHMDFLWKRKIDEKYKIPYKPSYIKKRNMFYYDVYKRCYTTQCVECGKKTSRIDFFHKQRVCDNCEKTLFKYKKISLTAAKTKYFLKPDDLSKLRFMTKNIAAFGYKKSTWYLESEVLNITKKKYEYSTFLEMKKHRLSQYIHHLLKKTYRFNLLRNYLLHTYEFDILSFAMHINRYSQGLYHRFLNYKGFRSTQKLFNDLVNRVLELKYLKDYHYENLSLLNFTYEDFNRTMLFHMLSEQDGNTDIPYIISLKVRIQETYSHLFIRKETLKSYLVGLENEYELTDYNIVSYICNTRDISLEEIKDEYLIKIYIRNDLQGKLKKPWYWYTFSQKELKTELNHMYDTGFIFPEYIMKKYIET